MHARPATATPGRTFFTSPNPGRAPNAVFSTNPRATGRIVTKRMDVNIPTASTSTLSPASHSVRSGVITGAASVETVVRPTENATSPLQRKVMMFEETPPGQHPTRISPTPTAFGNPSPYTSP